MFLSHFSEPIRERRCAAGDVSQPFDHSIELESPIEAMGKFGQVARQMLPAPPVRIVTKLATGLLNS